MQVAEPVEAPSFYRSALRQAQGPWLFQLSLRVIAMSEAIQIKSYQLISSMAVTLGSLTFIINCWVQRYLFFWELWHVRGNYFGNYIQLVP